MKGGFPEDPNAVQLIFNQFGQARFNDRTQRQQLTRILNFCIRNNFTYTVRKRDFRICRTFRQGNNIHSNNNVTFGNANPRGNFAIAGYNNDSMVLLEPTGNPDEYFHFVDLTSISLILGGQIKEAGNFRGFFNACCQYGITRRSLDDVSTADREYHGVVMFDLVDKVAMDQILTHWRQYGYPDFQIRQAYAQDVANLRGIQLMYPECYSSSGPECYIYPEFVVKDPNNLLNPIWQGVYNLYYPGNLNANYNNYNLKSTVLTSELNRTRPHNNIRLLPHIRLTVIDNIKHNEYIHALYNAVAYGIQYRVNLQGPDRIAYIQQLGINAVAAAAAAAKAAKDKAAKAAKDKQQKQQQQKQKQQQQKQQQQKQQKQKQQQQQRLLRPSNQYLNSINSRLLNSYYFLYIIKYIIKYI